MYWVPCYFLNHVCKLRIQNYHELKFVFAVLWNEHTLLDA
jgi:hypothetical protein